MFHMKRFQLASARCMKDIDYCGKWPMPSAAPLPKGGLPLAPARTSLCKIYVDALCGRAIFVHGGLNSRAAHFGLEPHMKTDLFAKLWFARPAHAELVALRCHKDFEAIGAMRDHGWVDLPPYQVADRIESVARMLGAKWQTEAQIQAGAKMVVAEIVARVEAARRGTGLKDINYGYKVYRLEQKAKGEKATSYAGYLNRYKRKLVVAAAQKLSG